MAAETFTDMVANQGLGGLHLSDHLGHGAKSSHILTRIAVLEAHQEQWGM